MPDNGPYDPSVDEIKVTVIDNHWDLLPQYLDQLRERDGQEAVDRTVAGLLDAAITHHKRDAERYDVPEIHDDEALWAARDRVLQASADPAR